MARKPKGPPSSDADSLLGPVESLIERGQLSKAIAALLPSLEHRAEAGDRACALAIRILQLSPAAETAVPRPPDALAATLDRLVNLVSAQEQQIQALRALVEDEL